MRDGELFRYYAVYSYRERNTGIMSKLRETMRDLQTKKHFDEDIPVDVEEVLDVAAALDIKEFEVFHLAYDWWHGEKSTDAEIEPVFVKYMFNSVVPPWVRQFTRMALQLRDEDRLDPDAFGVQQEPADAKMVSQGVRHSIILVLTLAALFMLGYLSRDLIFTYAYCMFPPCY
jgi:hypothetical protein